MTTRTTVLLCPPVKVLNRLSLKEREEVQYLAQMGMPAQGVVIHAIRRVIKVRKEMK
jgi:hypothetical protein